MQGIWERRKVHRQARREGGKNGRRRDSGIQPVKNRGRIEEVKEEGGGGKEEGEKL